MKALLPLLLFLPATFLLSSQASAQDAEQEETADSGMVRHVVVFKYAPDATEEQIQEITDALRDLKDKIPGIVSFEHGVNNSPEGRNQGFTHVYLITFENAAARDAYLPHPGSRSVRGNAARIGHLRGRLRRRLRAAKLEWQTSAADETSSSGGAMLTIGPQIRQRSALLLE